MPCRLSQRSSYWSSRTLKHQSQKRTKQVQQDSATFAITNTSMICIKNKKGQSGFHYALFKGNINQKLNRAVDTMGSCYSGEVIWQQGGSFDNSNMPWQQEWELETIIMSGTMCLGSFRSYKGSNLITFTSRLLLVLLSVTASPKYSVTIGLPVPADEVVYIKTCIYNPMSPERFEFSPSECESTGCAEVNVAPNPTPAFLFVEPNTSLRQSYRNSTLLNY